MPEILSGYLGIVQKELFWKYFVLFPEKFFFLYYPFGKFYFQESFEIFSAKIS